LWGDWSTPSNDELNTTYVIAYAPSHRSAYKETQGEQNTHFPMLTGWKTSHLTEGLVLHPLVLGDLADIAGVALHGEATAEGFDGILAEAVQGTMHAARWGNRGRLLRALGRAESSWDIERALGRTQLAGLQRELVQRSRGEMGRSGRVVGGSIGSRVGSRVGS
jgi:hypothetical protein